MAHFVINADFRCCDISACHWSSDGSSLNATSNSVLSRKPTTEVYIFWLVSALQALQHC